MELNKIVFGIQRLCFVGPRSLHVSPIHYSEEIQDPIQRLFLEKLKEYKQKSAGGKIIDPTPEIEKELKSELERINKQHGGDGNTDLTQFPEFNFPEVKIDPIINENKAKE